MPQRAGNSKNWNARLARPRLVALALADPPRPEELARRVREWAHTFARAYDGPPLLADYPEQVSKFFVKIGAVAVLRGQPCKDEATIAAAARAWEGAVYSQLD